MRERERKKEREREREFNRLEIIKRCLFVNLKLPVVASFYNSKRRERIIVNAIFFVIVVGD